MARYLVGSLVVLGVAACGRVWFEARDPWRHEAEVACLKAGAVRETPLIARIQPITGPGKCGADFPLKVAALGDGQALGYVDDPRPPGAIPNRLPLAEPPPYAARPQYAPYPQATYAPSAAPAGPMSIRPPEVEPDDVDEPGTYVSTPNLAAPPYQPQPQPGAAYPQRAPTYAAPASAAVAPQQPEQIPLGPARAPPMTTGATVVKPAATLACPLVSRLDNWMTDGVQPAAMRWFGQPVVEIKQISAYSCRSMNGQRGAPISEHAFGNALDVAAFTLADGRSVTVKDGWRGLPEEQGFLRDVHAAACQLFSTVLAPGSNAFHYDHIHVDLARRASGRSICNPAPIPGDAVAARVGNPYAARRGDAYITGSIKPHAASRMPAPMRRRERDSFDDALPSAVPGED